MARIKDNKRKLHARIKKIANVTLVDGKFAFLFYCLYYYYIVNIIIILTQELYTEKNKLISLNYNSPDIIQ